MMWPENLKKEFSDSLRGEVYIMSGKLFYINNNSTEDNIEKRQDFLVQAEAIVIGAGAGLSASAGFTYKGGTLS